MLVIHDFCLPGINLFRVEFAWLTESACAPCSPNDGRGMMGVYDHASARDAIGVFSTRNEVIEWPGSIRRRLSRSKVVFYDLGYRGRLVNEVRGKKRWAGDPFGFWETSWKRHSQLFLLSNAKYLLWVLKPSLSAKTQGRLK